MVCGMANLRDYYRRNFLYQSHRLILPEMREKVVRTCSECWFFVQVRGKTETRPGCAAIIPHYARLARRVPRELGVLEVLQAVGERGLEQVLARARPHRQACGLFCLKTDNK
jgi:hypothetical protein